MFIHALTYASALYLEMEGHFFIVLKEKTVDIQVHIKCE